MPVKKLDLNFGIRFPRRINITATMAQTTRPTCKKPGYRLSVRVMDIMTIINTSRMILVPK